MRTQFTAIAAMSIALALVVGPVAAAPQSDPIKAAEAAILEADRAFNRAVAEGNRQRFADLIAPDATFNGATANEARGRDAIVKSWEPFFAPGGPRLSWDPTEARVLVGGDVGVTIGTWTRRSSAPNGGIVGRGQYVTTWMKQADGRWLVAADIGSTAP